MRPESPPPPPGENIPFLLIPTLDALPVIEDDEPTIKMLVPPHLLRESRRPEQDEPKLRPNWGLIVAALFCLAFWGSVFYLFWRAHG